MSLSLAMFYQLSTKETSENARRTVRNIFRANTRFCVTLGFVLELISCYGLSDLD